MKRYLESLSNYCMEEELFCCEWVSIISELIFFRTWLLGTWGYYFPVSLFLFSFFLNKNSQENKKEMNVGAAPGEGGSWPSPSRATEMRETWVVLSPIWTSAFGSMKWGQGGAVGH